MGPPPTENLRVELRAWPTANPTWNGSIWDLSANKELVSATFACSWDNPYTGNIHETLTRPDLWECVGVGIEDPKADLDRPAMIQALKETLARDVRTVLLKVDSFYPQLECRAEAEALLAADRSYEAMVKLTGEIPQRTPWSHEKNIGTTDAQGVMTWRAISFGNEWNMPIGYVVLAEAMKRHLEGLDNM